DSWVDAPARPGENPMLTRRRFLQSSSLLALAPTVPLFITRTARAAAPDKNARVLVVVQLDGGNDALNTVVPHADPAYEKLRPKLKIAKRNLLRLSDTLGLHPSLKPLDPLLQASHVAVIPGVGYPNPNRSHFESMAIWHSARFDPEERNDQGWLGRALDEDRKLALGVPASVFVGSGQLPVALRGRRSIASALPRPQDFVLVPEAKAKAAAASAEK